VLPPSPGLRVFERTRVVEYGRENTASSGIMMLQTLPQFDNRVRDYRFEIAA
jgi:hypothetical protein